MQYFDRFSNSVFQLCFPLELQRAFNKMFSNYSILFTYYAFKNFIFHLFIDTIARNSVFNSSENENQYARLLCLLIKKKRFLLHHQIQI